MTFRAIPQHKGIYQCATSGSTGTPVIVQKYEPQKSTALFSFGLLAKWHGWSRNAKTLRISPAATNEPKKVGNYIYCNHYIETDCTQYLGLPSELPADISQFDRIAVTGERWNGIGIDIYSSEEFGVIAIQCPYNNEALHIMPYLDIKFANDGSMSITDTTHPYLIDYEVEDVAHPINCGCGINLKAMTHVCGRIRNRILMANGSRKFPVFGFRDCVQIKRFQIVQIDQNILELRYSGELPENYKNRICSALGQDFQIIKIKDKFIGSKHEEFISFL